MATLQYRTMQPLSLPDEAFNDEGVARIAVSGTSADGVWRLGVRSSHLPSNDNTLFGELETEEAPHQADEAVDAAEAWFREECARLGLEVLGFSNLNESYALDDPSSAGYQANARSLVRRVQA